MRVIINPWVQKKEEKEIYDFWEGETLMLSLLKHTHAH